MLPEFYIDINKSKREKWGVVEEYFKPYMAEMRNAILKMYEPLSGMDFVLKGLVWLKRNSLYYRDDLEYFAQVLNLDLHIILIVNLFYELSSACTTICTNINGKNMMFRTMDWDLEFLKKVTFIMKTDNYEAITWFGCVGLFTASNNHFSVAINYRRTKSMDFMTVITNAFKTIRMDFPASYLMREIFDRDCDYKTAYDALCTSDLISPVYFTVCPKISQPTIIVRWCNSFEIVKCANNYLCQTNIDENNEGDNILWSIERKEVVKRIMENAKLNSEMDLIDKINMHPIINHETIYVSVLIPGDKIVGKVVSPST